jgi:hypothetical protein
MGSGLAVQQKICYVHAMTRSLRIELKEQSIISPPEGMSGSQSSLPRKTLLKPL